MRLAARTSPPSHHIPRITSLATHACSFWVCVTVMSSKVVAANVTTTVDYADSMMKSMLQLREQDAAWRAQELKERDEKFENKEKQWEEKFEKKEKHWEDKLEKKDTVCNQKIEKIKQECDEKIEKIKQECGEKLEKILQECDAEIKKIKQGRKDNLEDKIKKIIQDCNEKLEKKHTECEEKLAKKHTECEELTKIKTAKIRKVQSWRKTNMEKFMNSGCDEPQVIATLAKDMGNTSFMTGDIVQDRVKLMIVNDWECAAFSKRCAQVKQSMQNINNKRKHDQINCETGASVTD